MLRAVASIFICKKIPCVFDALTINQFLRIIIPNYSIRIMIRDFRRDARIDESLLNIRLLLGIGKYAKSERDFFRRILFNIQVRGKLSDQLFIVLPVRTV